ncbi:hypothetical protein P3T73_01155 [Kiritimatiellota bacterium B12222]|nr:hypothetical protein P3T73_01155 [Kiritimatiellota bacterium B12222]
MKNFCTHFVLLLTYIYVVYPQVPETYPQWWSDYGIIDLEGDHSNNHGIANQGQAKNFTLKAIAYLDEILAPIGGAGFTLDDLLNDRPANHHAPLKIGQLKNLTAPFYQRFAEIGFTPTSPGWPAGMLLDEGVEDHAKEYPWLENTTPDNQKNANIGQLKNLFSWELMQWVLIDEDVDNLPDYWEVIFVREGLLDQDGDGDVDVWDVGASDDFDLDGVSNFDEYLNGTDPTKADSDQDGRLDTGEILLGTNPLWPDHPDVALQVEVLP